MQRMLAVVVTWFAVVGCGLLSAGTASADPIYVSDGNTNKLYTVDSSTYVKTLVGTSGVTFTDIAFDGGSLYGITFGGLYSINTTTAAQTFIGNLGVSDMNALVFGADGTLYAAGGGTLYEVNTATGAASTIGNTGYSSSGDLSFDGSGDLYLSATGSGSDRLIRVDTTTGAGTLVGNIGYTNVYGLAYVGGTMFSVTYGGDLLSLNTATGAGTFLSNIGVGAWGAATTPVPEPATLALFGLGAAGLWRRRRKAAAR